MIKINVLQANDDFGRPSTDAAYRSDWLEHFVVDKAYSVKTMDFLEGKTDILARGIRAEIVSALYHKVLQYTRRPTSKEYNAICQALVTEFPCLADSEEAPYVSQQ